jgi:hypothetical protein
VELEVLTGTALRQNRAKQRPSLRAGTHKRAYFPKDIGDTIAVAHAEIPSPLTPLSTSRTHACLCVIDRVKYTFSEARKYARSFGFQTKVSIDGRKQNN